jgi:hypothetical protein
VANDSKEQFQSADAKTQYAAERLEGLSLEDRIGDLSDGFQSL